MCGVAWQVELGGPADVAAFAALEPHPRTPKTQTKHDPHVFFFG